MLRLNLPTEPAWHDMANGVRLFLRPASAAILTAADIAADRALREVGTAMDEPMRLGLAIQVRAEQLARALVADWSGVADGAGQDLLLTLDNVALLMRSSPEIMLRFLDVVRAPFDEATAEGNA